MTDDGDLPDTDIRRRPQVRDAATRRARQRGRELMLDLYRGAVPKEFWDPWTAAEAGAKIERLVGRGQPTQALRAEAIRGAAELLDELAAQLRKAAK